MPKEISVVYEPRGKEGSFPIETDLLTAAKRLGIDLSSLCGGIGTCGKCKVKVLKGFTKVSPLSDTEKRRLTSEEIEENYRLACQVKVLETEPVGRYAGGVVYVPEMSRVGKQRLQTEGMEVPVKTLSPLVKKYFVKMPKPTLDDHRADDDRLLHELEEQHGLKNLWVDYKVLQELPIILRKKDWTATAVVRENRIIAVEPGDTTDRCFGFACDIGTTKLAGFLMDLNAGKVVSVAARMNPQIPYGEELMTRVTHASMEEKGRDDLQKAVVGGLNEIIEECCEKAGVKTEEIYDLVFVGNTGMQMFFLKYWPLHVAFSPYPPVRRGSTTVLTREIGLKAQSNSRTQFLPVIGGFVGADNVAVLMATRMLDSNKICLAVDIGTNTEIDLGNKEQILVDSCASGPAFEGMEIKCGMRAATGAIEKVSIDPDTYDVLYRAIEEAPPIGICGSALIDIPAEFLKTRVIDWGGRFNYDAAKETKRIREGQEGWEFVIAWAKETGTKEDIVVTQGDIREVQKAKAAMHTGAAIMMGRLGLTAKDISTLYVAGAFGSYIDAENARTIGMYPEVPIERIKFVGNAAGTGARMALISEEERDYAERISRTVKYIELANDPGFQLEYVNSTYFPHKRLDLYPITTDLLKRTGALIG